MGTDESEELATQSLVHQLRARRSNMMVAEVETVALRLFHERGFSAVTVEEIASAARISVRTFYRYCPSKEDVLQVQIDRRAEAVRAALAARPVDEAPLHSLRVALTEAIASEDAGRTRTWTEVVAAAPEVLQAVLGGILLKTQRAIAEFFAARLDAPDDSLVPTMLAAAAVGIIQTSQAHWLIYGGDLTTRISEGFEVLEHGIGSDPRTWSAGT